MRLDHINIRTDNLDGVRDSFVRILRLKVGDRPPFTFPGYWLHGEGHPIVHLTQRDSDPGNSTGALDHVAFWDDDFDGLMARLAEDDIAYDLRIVPDSGIRQVFFHMNHDVKVEVDFDPAP